MIDGLWMIGQKLVEAITVLLPSLIGSILLFLFGWIFAILVSRFFVRILKLVKFEAFMKEHKVEDALGTVKISDVLGKIVKYYIILLFLQAAVSNVWLGTLSNFLSVLLMYVPVLVAAILIVLASVILGEYLKEMIVELSKSPLVKLCGRAVKILVIYIGLVMGLDMVGFNTALITGIFLTVLQGIVFGVALAIGIAFGFGGQDDAKDFIKSSRKHFRL